MGTVTMTHPTLPPDQTAIVPSSAVPQHQRAGWTVTPTKPRRRMPQPVLAPPAEPEPAPAEQDDTTTETESEH